MTANTEPAVEPDDGDATIDTVSGETIIGMQKLLGYRLAAWREGFCRIVVRLGERHHNRFGATHGGLFATLADAAGGFSGCYPRTPGERRRCVTLSLTTNFIAQPTDDTMIAQATVRGGGRSVFFSDIEVTDGTGRLLATATGTFRYRNPPGGAASDGAPG